MLKMTRKILIILAISTLPLDVSAISNIKPQSINVMPNNWLRPQVNVVPYSGSSAPNGTVAGSRDSASGVSTSDTSPESFYGSRPASNPSYTVSGTRTSGSLTPSYTVGGSRTVTSSSPSYTVSGTRTSGSSTPSYTVSGSRPSSTPSYTVSGSRPTTPTTSSCTPKYPRDIDGHWSEIYVRRLYELCVVEGYSENQTFRPNQYITRAELTKMALAAAKIGRELNCKTDACGTPFTDLQGWQGQWIRAAYDRGIIIGFDNSRTFLPNREITRAEATKVVLATFGLQPVYVEHSFFFDVTGWATGWIEKAHLLGFVQGIGQGNFAPERPITRAEAAKIIAKALEYFAYRN